jgi:thiol-disulfide isomerase/thioredoxin
MSNEASSRRTGFPVALIVALVAGAGVLYGIYGHAGKETAPGVCVAAAARAQELAPLALGQVAALSVSKTPREATPIAFSGPQGEALTLAALKGRTILLNLWATWCVPCREEMPSLDKLQAALGGPDFEVVAVNIDTTRLERRQAFLKEAGVERLAFYANPTAEVFQTLKKAGKVVGLPTTILIDPEGCELGVMPGPADWASSDALKLLSGAIGRRPAG